MTDWWWVYLALGAFIGFFAGLLGIGGGFVMIPVLALVYAAKGFPAAHVLHLALGTGMATILFTSASSVRSHHLRGAVNWQVVKHFVPGIVVGTFCGAILAGHLDVKKLSLAFTAIVYYAALRLLLDREPKATAALPGRTGMYVAGGLIGAVSGFAAMGGAVLTVPFLVKRKIRVHEAIASAAAVGWPIALAGTVGFIVSGYDKPGLPAHSWGYVYLPAVFWIVVSSVLLAPLGAAVAHRTPARTLKRIFAVLLCALATKMLLTFF